MTIAVITDSSCQLSAIEAGDAGIVVVPITIVVDGESYRDGVDISPEEFYGRLGEGVQLSTAQPAPGAFIAAWTDAIGQGATEIVSVHVGEALSGTLNSARVAMSEVPVPVHLIDSKSTSYGLGMLALAIAERVKKTGSTSGIETFAADLVSETTTVFILQDLRYIMKGGRMRPATLPDGTTDVPVLGGKGGTYALVGTGTTIEDLVEQMAQQLLDGDYSRHVALAIAAPGTEVYTDALEDRMRQSPLVASVRRYVMGPAIAVHTGPGTAGGFCWPVQAS